MKHKWILTVLTVALFAVLLVFSVSAETVSGTCGDKLTWTLDTASGMLTISGQGEMKDSPWSQHKSSITQVVINEGCTNITASAFARCDRLTVVSLPTSVKEVGGGAFASCTALRSINLDFVSAIGERAFEECLALTEVKMTQELTQIYSYAFAYCKALSKVTFSDKLTTIGALAFYGCSSLQTVTIPNSVTSIDESAFCACIGMTSINIGTGVTELGDSAFSNCEKLISVRIPDKVTELFRECRSLKEVHIGASVARVDIEVFENCPSMTTITLSSGNKNLIVDRNVLYKKESMQLLYMPPQFSGAYTVLPGTTKILEKSCAGAGITELTVPSSVTAIQTRAFYNCTRLKVVKLSDGLHKIVSEAFAGTAVEEVTIPKTLTFLATNAFRGCKSLKKVTFLGAPPKLTENADGSILNGITATVHYPGGYTEWETAKPYFGSSLKWESYFCNSHTFVEVPGKAATCTETGLTAGTRCSVCGKFSVEQKETPKTPHRFGPWQEMGGEGEPGVTLGYRLCSDCLHFETKDLSSKDEATEPNQPQTTTPNQPQTTTPTQPQTTTPNQTVEQESAEPTAQTAPTETTQGDASKDTEATKQTEPTSTEQEPQKPKKRKGLLWGVLVSVVIVALLGVRVWLWYR